MNKYLPTAERWFVIISLLLYTSGLILLILSGGAGEGLVEEVFPDPINYSLQQNIFFLTYVVSVFLLILRWKKAIYTLSKDWTIWVLTLMGPVSVIWSTNPTITLPRSIALIGTSLVGLYLASRYSVREQLKLLGWSFLLIIILSFLFAILIPYYGTMDRGIHAGAWRGIFLHKNVLGKLMGLSGIIFLVLVMDLRENRWFAWTGLVLSCSLLVLSRSSSSMINFLSVVALVPIYNTFRWRYYLMIPAIIAITILAGGMSLWLDQNAGILLGSIGKDPTLTGRTNMWPYIMEMVWKQPWLGYGYNGFWYNWNSPAAYVWSATGWTSPNSHNGFLDLWLDFGLVGVIIFAIGFFQTFLRGLKQLRTDKYATNFWSLLYLTYLVLCNLTESSLAIRNDIFWLLYITTSFSLAMNTLKTDKMSVKN
jgi:exopolysaccharide production protein ExoQ